VAEEEAVGVVEVRVLAVVGKWETGNVAINCDIGVSASVAAVVMLVLVLSVVLAGV
jgi:hypothetical protein